MVPSPLPLALTLGEPAGIGPDIALLAWQRRNEADGPFLVIGDRQCLADRAKIMRLDIPLASIAAPSEAAAIFHSALPVLAVPLAAQPVPGVSDPAAAGAVVRAIEIAVALALAGAIAGIVTNPIHKESLYRAGFAHQGHTDFLAHLAAQAGHPAEPVMMLSAGTLRTVPLTIHIPLKDVPQAITEALIVGQARIVARELSVLLGGSSRPGKAGPGKAEPVRLAVAGLNPHAGENGAIGTEERDIIAPAVARLQAEGLDVTGPLSADTLFHDEVRHRYDVILCMYHDQALIPVKTVGFHEGVNTTLGLPFVRTSPDHGTALGLAGTGEANPSSLLAALNLARQFAAARQRA
jgi:4-hydroxythreonine-4-phosphate dehydrogenase